MKHLTAIFCLTLVILLGSAGNSESADFQKGLTAAQSGDFATALREWTPLAKQGDVNAQYNLGVMYDQGDGVSQDYKTAVKWYTLAAKQRHAFAQSNLGQMWSKNHRVSAGVTQVVECVICNHDVRGSTPLTGTTPFLFSINPPEHPPQTSHIFGG